MPLTLNGSGSITGVSDSTGLGAAWTSYTPTITSGTGTITSTTVNSSAYTQIGKVVIWRFDVTITNAGTGAGSLLLTPPVTPKTGNQMGVGREAVNTGKSLWAGFDATTSTLSVRYFDNTTMIATNSRAVCAITYEAA